VNLDGKKVHFVGAGGIGMSALALLAREAGALVSGCDLVTGKGVELLRRHGIPVEIGHSPEHVAGADLVVYSKAVPLNHPELAAVAADGARLLSREHLLSLLMRPRRGVGVTGAHGKTTTTWLLGRILIEAGFDPTVLVGGIVDELSGNFRLGSAAPGSASDGVFVTEVDESNGIVADFHPLAAVVTNVDDEHLDLFADRMAMADAVSRFLHSMKQGGIAVLSADDPVLVELAARLRSDRPDLAVLTVGFSASADARINEARDGAFSVALPQAGAVELKLRIPGRHNVANGALAAAAASWLGAPPAAISAALAAAPPVHRRQELVARAAGVVVYDDYAHHPTEILATHNALSSVVKGRFIAVFQPHRYTRTRALWTRFIEALSNFDYVVFMEIYAASETPLAGVSSAALARDALKKRLNVQYISRAHLVVEHLASIVKPGDVVITLGAGDVGEVAYALAERLERPDQD